MGASPESITRSGYIISTGVMDSGSPLRGVRNDALRAGLESLLFERDFNVRFLFQPLGHRQLLRTQEFRIEQLGLVARSAVGEHRDDGLARPQLLGEADSAGDVDAGRAAKAEAFVLEQIEYDRYGLFVGNEIGLLDFDVVDDRRHAAEPDAFGDRAALGGFSLALGEQVVHRGAARISNADHDVLLLLMEKDRGARDRAAGADRADEAVDPALRLLPYFRAGREIMRQAVVAVVPLVGEQHAVLLGLAQLVGEAPRDMLVVVGVGVGQGRNLDQLRAAEPQHVLLFLALGVWD